MAEPPAEVAGAAAGNADAAGEDARMDEVVEAHAHDTFDRVASYGTASTRVLKNMKELS